MPLILEIEFLLGIAFAAIGPDRAEPDWPPQPDRVFSALVAAWAARGERAPERAALEWLERQPGPGIACSEAAHRPALTTFVPPNDKATAPEARRRQPRRFPAALPTDPIVRLVWPDAADAPVAALDAIARDVGYIGHSASLTRCCFADAPHGPGALRRARRLVYGGRLRELERAWAVHRRPAPGRFHTSPPAASEPTNPFSSDWLVFAIEDGALDARAAPLAAKRLRDCIMSGYGAAGLAIPESVSGHEPGGAPSRQTHLAILPLAYVGYEHADGHLLGFALVPPRGCDLFEDRSFHAAMRKVTATQDGKRVLSLGLGQGVTLSLTPVIEDSRRSMEPGRYTRASARWATATPLVLDRHLKQEGPAARQDEIEDLIACACERIAGRRPTVIADKHSAVLGAVSAAPSGGAPRWTSWRVPESLRSRPLSHAVMTFAEPVPGPLLIGAGRHVGLGLCLPLDP